MTYLALVGVPRTAYTLNEAVIQARLRGFDVALVDRAAGLAAVPGTMPVSRLVEVDRMTPDDVAQALAALRPERVLSFSELHLGLAARVRERLGVPGEAGAVEDLVRDKGATRHRLVERGLSRVRHAMTTLADLPRAAAEFAPPFVVKPVDMTGSIGVRAIRSHSELAAYGGLFEDPSVEAHQERRLLLEEFITGTEYSVEGICVAGTFHLHAVTQKATSGFPDFYETGHLLPARAQYTDGRFAPYLQKVVTALGITTAPIHAEVKVTDEAIDLIEIHSRFGGDLIPLLLERALDIKVFGQFYDALLSGSAPRTPTAPGKVAGVRFIGRPVDGTGLRLPALPSGVEAEIVLTGSHAREPVALDNIRIPNRRYGHVLFTAPDHEAAEKFTTLMENDWQASS
ncbi:ATP-grasp domain-containing protein [Streptomyces spongiae]|uniref:ATP-grasp domain-containing protein n=1 Tax=Streptomyces spongiae TaxID=565072 RepID=A0A5N8XF06_9ACTN|nr:ATP-grasp domain-containing protein [Streptomyces spongiae]MPY57145.1 ATP-grasp domain-containing protein [Streptomyces spongiae]